MADMILEQDKAVGYLTATLRAGVWAVRYMLNLPEYLNLMGLDSIPVDMEAPNEQQSYPYVHVMYKNRGISPTSLKESHWGEILENGVKNVNEFAIYKFIGDFTLNIYATTILERETIADIIIGALAIDPRFRQKLLDNPYIGLTPNMDTFDTLNSNESWGTPWSAEAMTAFRQCNFSVIGEFVWRKVTPVQFITSIMIRGDISEAL